MRTRQRGIGCTLCMLATVVVVGLALGGIKMVKAYIQNVEIRHLLQNIAQDAELQSANENQIRMAFARRAEVGEIAVVQPDDVQLARTSGMLRLSADYDVEIPVAGNVSIVMHFHPNSDKQ